MVDRSRKLDGCAGNLTSRSRKEWRSMENVSSSAQPVSLFFAVLELRVEEGEFCSLYKVRERQMTSSCT